ncbi:PREDICTED: zinc finger protein 346-like [Priapulus caudatus]|uniref:Zinc finger protein 346-like n=1 Tax=Priapulus caudatus TaxID=37621 RepID=A0ABM1DSG8_PRICU|nr:PREDICTED: zinc finger protein 346-like [Priapulus caudatus]
MADTEGKTVGSANDAGVKAETSGTTVTSVDTVTNAPGETNSGADGHVNDKAEQQRIQLKKALQVGDDKPSVASFLCDVCGVSLNSKSQLEQHLLGGKHQRALEQQNKSGTASPTVAPISAQKHSKPTNPTISEKPQPSQQPGMPLPPYIHPTRQSQSGPPGTGSMLENGWFYCSSCDVTVNSACQLQQHLSSRRHLAGGRSGKSADETSKQGNPPAGKAATRVAGASVGQEALSLNVTGNLFCKVCDVATNSVIQYEQHMGSQKHRDRVNGEPPKQWKAKSSKPSQAASQPFGSRPGQPYYYKRPQEEWMDANSSETDPTNQSKVDQYLTNFAEQQPLSARDQIMRYNCTICNVSLNSLKQRNQHMESKKHKDQESRVGSGGPTLDPSGADGLHQAEGGWERELGWTQSKELPVWHAESGWEQQDKKSDFIMDYLPNQEQQGLGRNNSSGTESWGNPHQEQIKTNSIGKWNTPMASSNDARPPTATENWSSAQHMPQ